MSSKAITKEILKRMDQRWTAHEKMDHYKGLIKIFDRERKKESNCANELRRKQTQQILELRKDCTYFRSYLKDSVYGHRQRLRSILQYNRSFALGFQNALPQKVSDEIEHINNRGKRDLDRLKYMAHKRMKLFAQLKLEMAVLKDRIEAGFVNVTSQRSIQVLQNACSTYVMRQNIAAQVHKLYRNILGLLRKDSFYFDNILNVLHSDCKEQCGCVLLAAELGELAHEELSDIREEYKWLDRVVRINMKDRDREVKRLKKCTYDLNLTSMLMTQSISVPTYDATPLSSSLAKLATSTAELEAAGVGGDKRGVENIEELMKEVQEATTAFSFQDIFPIILSQLSREETLCMQMQKMTNFRNRLLRSKHQAELMLISITYNATTFFKYYERQQERLKKEIDEQKHRLEYEREVLAEYGEMVGTLKVVLQGMFETLDKVKEESTSDDVHEFGVASDIYFDRDMSPEEVEKTFVPPIEPDSTKLLQKIGRRLKRILKRVKETPDEETIEKANFDFQQMSLKNRIALIELDAEASYNIPLLEEEISEDTNVLTRADIKRNSKDLVDRHKEILSLAHSGLKARKSLKRSIG